MDVKYLQKKYKQLDRNTPPPHVKLNGPGSIVLKYYRKYNLS